MKIEILRLKEGARRARGLTVIIDVFRAYTVECALLALGAREITAVGALEDAWALKRERPDALLVGERGGWKIEGFDCGNSPSQLERLPVAGRRVIHTTSAGTQGAALATEATELLGGALVNARATAAYIRARQPEAVSLVAMGLDGETPTDEDELCAEYLRALIRGEAFDVEAGIPKLAQTTGAKFFDPARQEAFPRDDFDRCTRVDRYDFALRLLRTDRGLKVERVDGD